MHTVLVTVRTPSQALDLELAAEMPVGTLMPALLAVCRLTPGGAVAPTWTLGVEGGMALPATRSLAECGIVDGARLVLCADPAWPIQALPTPDGRWR